ncbi:MAG: DUF5674 family protein [Candidatus Saccharimonadales bacterium]
MKIVDKISVKELSEMSEKMYEPLVKAVVDIRKRSLVVDAEMHVDEEAYLLEHDSQQQDLWGINLYPNEFGKDNFIEFDSMINIRPRQNNRSRGVEDVEVQRRIREVVSEAVHE